SGNNDLMGSLYRLASCAVAMATRARPDLRKGFRSIITENVSRVATRLRRKHRSLSSHQRGPTRMSLNGKHALITGSSRGIGRGIALKLAEHGVNVAVHYYQNEAAALDTLAQVRDRGADGFVVQAD